MYRKILVPLDGSELAENALSQVRNLTGLGSVGEVTLLNVIEIDVTGLFSEGSTRNFDLPALRKAHFEESRKYLEKIQSQLSAEGIKVTTETLEGRPAQMIVDYSQKNSVDLIVIATHGYSGMKRLMFGSVALRVLHDSHAPVLLIRPESCR
ncbi:MAG: universal stress protein [Smithellaceae bacterium]|nr:universal stress protein [Smithellaceae bacterium]